ncbi:MAG: hypothetical protein HYU86_06460 [Chloroflexi bacterium]|nr:hypothetical protein [Chloroflexota bacterium]
MALDLLHNQTFLNLEVQTTKRYLISILIVLVLASGVLIACSEETTTYYHREFGYSVKMPKSWEVVENPVHSITGRPLKNTVGFRSELSLEADWLDVEVRTNESAYSAVSNLYQPSNTESKLYEYGKNGYVHETRWLGIGEKSWRISYYIGYNKRLYVITFNTKETRQKAYVSIDGYGKVNY